MDLNFTPLRWISVSYSPLRVLKLNFASLLQQFLKPHNRCFKGRASTYFSLQALNSCGKESCSSNSAGVVAMIIQVAKLRRKIQGSGNCREAQKAQVQL